MINLLLNVNHSVALLRYCIGCMYIVGQTWNFFVVVVWIGFMAATKLIQIIHFSVINFKGSEANLSPDVLCSTNLHFAELWHVWCICVCSRRHLPQHCNEMKVLCTWKSIQMNFLFQRAVMGVRQASETELLPEHMWATDVDNIYHCVPCSMSILLIFIKDVSGKYNNFFLPLLGRIQM